MLIHVDQKKNAIYFFSPNNFYFQLLHLVRKYTKLTNIGDKEASTGQTSRIMFPIAHMNKGWFQNTFSSAIEIRPKGRIYSD